MTSKIKVDNINKVSDDSNIIKKCGTTTTIGSGASNPIVVDGSAVTIGRCGGTVALASGATQTGFGRTGTVDWQTTPKTATFTAANGEGYFINQGSAITANLPAGSAGAIVSFSDYARNFATYNFTIAPNGSEKIGGVAQDLILSVNGQALTLVYVDSTKGWINIQNAEDTETGITPSFYAATGGTITTVCTNFKVHTFTSPGTFCVSSLGNSAGGGATVAYMVIAGAGGGGSAGGGGGAGGYREGKCSVHSYTASPLATTGFEITSTGAIPITVGAGGSGGTSNGTGTKGSDAVFSTITSAGGGAGRGHNAPTSNTSGGSGGGGGSSGCVGTLTGGSGNTPPVSPPQGNDGGTGVEPVSPAPSGGGAGGAGGALSPLVTENGGPGTATSINGTPTTRAGGGSAGPNGGVCGSAGAGAGGGPGGGPTGVAGAGTANTGSGGGGGAPFAGSTVGGAGGSGIVIIRYKFQ